MGNTSTGATIDGVYSYGRNCFWYRCRVDYCGRHGFWMGQHGNIFLQCECKNHGRGGNTSYGYVSAAGGKYHGCMSWCSSDELVRATYGFQPGYLNDTHNCIAYRCFRGFYVTANVDFYSNIVHNCLAHSCSNLGFYVISALGSTHLWNCLSINSGSWAYYLNTTGRRVYLHKCGHYGSGTGALFEGSAGEAYHVPHDDTADGLIALSEDPIVDPANGDFRFKPNIIGTLGEQILGGGMYKDILFDGQLTDLGSPDIGPSQRPRHRRRT
jgi:hypothetical protein